ncbi:PilZ domain-containing protein [Deltaproteobacteria bacterium TL4]
MRSMNKEGIVAIVSKYVKMMTRASLFVLLWLFLTGQSHRGRRIDVNLTLDNLWQAPSMPAQIPPSFYFLLAIVLLVTGCGAYFIFRLRKQKAEQQYTKIAEEKANMQLEMKLSRMNLKPETMAFLETLLASSNPRDILPIVQSVESFEAKVTEYKKTHKEAKLFKQIFDLRLKLGYEFKNRTVPFVCTQMLSPELKLECRIPHPEKRIVFMTPIIDVGETRLLIKPPTIKGKPVNLKRFPKLVFTILREEDAEYEFTLPVVNQVSDKLDAVILGHSSTISKMFIREAERIPMNMATTFYHLSEAQLGVHEKSSELPAGEPPFKGRIEDMSSGGLKVVASQISVQLRAGDYLAFHLEGANLRENLIARIAAIRSSNGETLLNCQFVKMRDIVRMKINKFLHRIKKQGTQKLRPSPEVSAPPLSSGASKQDRNAAVLKSEERKALLEH